MSRIDAATAYLRELVVAYESLERERKQLLDAAQRLQQIAAEKADLVADAQAALDKLNALQGTDYTLAQIRKRFVPSTETPA
jgi:uncharacterized protein (DUF3084 family)